MCTSPKVVNDISKSLGLSLKTLDNFLRVSVSVSKKLVSEKSLGISIEKFGLGIKVSVSVSEKLFLGKKSRYWYQSKFWPCLKVPRAGMVGRCSVGIERKSGATNFFRPEQTSWD